MTSGRPVKRHTADPLLGQHVLGYKLKRLLGQGGMGAVYEAEHPEIRQRSAVKVLFTEYSSDEEFVRRFVYEARAASQVQHPGLVKIYNHGQLTDGTAFIMMEFLDGESLRERIERLEASGEHMPISFILNIARQIADALIAVHRTGIVHRDLKPANLILVSNVNDGGNQQIKLVDFGIAKFDSDAVSELSKTTVGRFLGTALYASPEQCQMAGKVGTKADVYSLGVVLYEMLAGKPPFIADQPGMVIGMHLFKQPVPLWELARQIPFSLCLLIQDMLGKNPEQRPSMEQVAKRLATVRLDESVLRGLIRRRVWLLIGASGLGLLVAIAFGYVVSLRRSSRSVATPIVVASDRPPTRSVPRDDKPRSDMAVASKTNIILLNAVPTTPSASSKNKPSVNKKSPRPGISPARTTISAPAPVLPAQINPSPQPSMPSALPPKQKKTRPDNDDEAFY